MNEENDQHVSLAKQTFRSLLFLPLTFVVVAIAGILPLKEFERASPIIPVTSLVIALVVYSLYRIMFGSFAPTAAPKLQFDFKGVIGLLCGFLAGVLGVVPPVLLFLALGGGVRFSLTLDALIYSLLLALAVALQEEVIFRGLLLHWLKRFSPTWVAVIVVATVFTLLHMYDGRPVIALLATFVGGGLVYTIAFLAFKNIWVPIGLHTGFNTWAIITERAAIDGYGYIQLLGSRPTLSFTYFLGFSLILLGFAFAYSFRNNAFAQFAEVERCHVD